jgi:hypothetical protein
MTAINDRTGDRISSCIAVKIQLKTHTVLENTTTTHTAKSKHHGRGKNDYHATLIHFMTFTNGIAYAKDHQFVQDELAPLTLDDVARRMCQKAYVTPDPDANPTQARSLSLEYWKKAISYYMPNCLMPWNAVSGQRNPTRSIEVNTLIKKVKKKEVRKQGVASKARRAITHVEFRRMHSILREKNDVICRYGIPSLLTKHMMTKWAELWLKAVI